MAADPEAIAPEVFEAGQDTKVEEDFSYDEDAPNLAAEFKKHPEGRAALKRISMKCLDDFEQAWKASDHFRTSNAKIWNLFTGKTEEKKPEFEHLANAHVPLLMENIVRMTYRQEYELFGNWTQVFGVTPIGPDDEHTAKLLSLHGNWQIRTRIKDFKRQVGHRGLLLFNLFGDVNFHSYWDPQRKTNRHEVLTCDNFVTAYTHVSTMPDYSDVSWVAKVIDMDAHELRKMSKSWEDVEGALKMMPPVYDDPSMERLLTEAVERSVGVDPTEFDSGQYKVIQYEGWLNLPAQGRDRYCKVMIDKQTSTIMHLAIHERTDPFEKRRFEFQQEQLKNWQASRAEVQAFQQEQQQTQQSAMDMGLAQDPRSDLMSQSVSMARAVGEMPGPQELPMPDWMNNNPEAQPEPAETVPIRMFTHAVNIEPLQGVIGLGAGAILAPFNRAANILLSMFIDQGTLNNMKQFLASDNARLPNKLVLEPGKIHKLAGVIDLSKEFIPLEFGEANPQLVQLIDMLTKFGQTVSNTPEVLSGEAGKSGETAQGIANRIEQATKMLSVPTGKYADAVSNVLVNNAILNALFLQDVEFFSVNNHDPSLGQMGRTQFSVGRDMYDRPYDVEISADLKFTSTAQRISEADALVQLPQAVMPLQGNYAFQYATIQKSLEARNRYDLISLLGAAPPPPPAFGAPTSPPAPPPGSTPSPQNGAPGGAKPAPNAPAKPQPAAPPAQGGQQ